jgi:sugar/nucleoside kinase (ribokinase family)
MNYFDSPMSHYDLYAVGNALVDSEYEVSDQLLQEMGVDKRHMSLIDSTRRTELLRHVQGMEPRKSGGGSAGNTVVAMAQLGGKAFYSCRVSDDQLGHFYTDDLLRNGVSTNLTHTKAPHGQTGSCMVFVTPDAERSLCTFLGATADLDITSLHPGEIAKSKIYYMEGYLAASETGLKAALGGKETARNAGILLAATLSDTSMISHCRAGLEAILCGGLDFVFCNEEEASTWCQSETWDEIAANLGALAKTVCITRGAAGCSILSQGSHIDIPAFETVAVDTNGAGDMFAGAFLYGATHGYSHEHSALLGNRCAAAVVGQRGNRLDSEKLQSIRKAIENEFQATRPISM